MSSLFCFILVFLSIITLHPGRTDSNGGHFDRSTGKYHYHHGYPAHQHENGICPYDFDDRTGENSGSSVTRSFPSDEEEKPKRDFFDIAENVFLIFVGVWCVYKIVWFFFIEPRIVEARNYALCRICGKRVPKYSKRCPYCGAKNPYLH